MRRRHTAGLPLRAVIDEFIEQYHLRNKLNETKIIQSWEKTVGPMIAKNTRDLKVRNRVLYVRVDSSALRNELVYARTKLLNSLNSEAGSKVIDDVVIN